MGSVLVEGPSSDAEFVAAEFFAGIGLVRAALAEAKIDVAWANDIEPVKAALYAANYPDDHYVIGDVCDVKGDHVPDVDLATASFPCTDLSLAGNRMGLAGTQSSMFWEFARVLEEMRERRPRAVLLENVPGFATSHKGKDLHDAVKRLNGLGYSCDVFQVDARHFVAQSRLRLFIVGLQEPIGERPHEPDSLRPQRVVDLAQADPDLQLHANPDLKLPPAAVHRLADVAERIPVDDAQWWDAERLQRFLDGLSPKQAERLEEMRMASDIVWRSAYRRTRNGVSTWEIRSDEIAGCLRTARGGSSKQALVQAGNGAVHVRWMTGREYARLQGVDDEFDFAGLNRNQVMSGFGDAVCVPVVAWIATAYLAPALARRSGTADVVETNVVELHAVAG